MSLVLSAEKRFKRFGPNWGVSPPSPKNWLTARVKKCAENTNQGSEAPCCGDEVSGNCTLIIHFNPQIQCFPIFQNFTHSPWFLNFKTFEKSFNNSRKWRKNWAFKQTAWLQSGLWYYHHHHNHHLHHHLRYYYYYYNNRIKTFFKILHIICLVVIVPQWIII